MRLPHFTPLALVTVAALGLTACGGSGHGFRAGNQNITVTSNALPSAVSGQAINHVIPLSGGCGGPYRMSVIAGALPPGLRLDDDTHAIVGVILIHDLNYAFTIQIDDTGCTPFSSTIVSFQWSVPLGPVTIAACDPPLIPFADYDPLGATPWPGYDALETTTYGANSVFNFLIAGGTPPYELEVIDDPNNPDDANWQPPPGSVPLGMNIPEGSTTFMGAPSQTGGATPFLLTFQVRDSTGAVGQRTLQWRVDTPPIVFGTTVLPAGKCGYTYGQTIQIADGVPPYSFEVCRRAGKIYDDDDWNSPDPPTVYAADNPAVPILVDGVTGMSDVRCTGMGPGDGDYPAANFAGPYGGATNGTTPEGVMMVEDTGQLTGRVRRRGSFTFHIHAWSSLVPNEYGQHAWHTYSNVNFADSEPPLAAPPTPPFGFGSINTWTLDGALTQVAPYAMLRPFEQGVPYDPDGGPMGLQCIAVGGVAKDGYDVDMHHLSEAEANDAGVEVLNTYDWECDYAPNVPAAGPTDLLDLGTEPDGIDFQEGTGYFVVPDENDLVPQAPQLVKLYVTDVQLPTATRHATNTFVELEVGPDKLIITESPADYFGGQVSTSLNDSLQTVRVATSSTTTPLAVRDLDDAQDLAASSVTELVDDVGGLTSYQELATLLSEIDVLRVTVNPTGHWDDVHGMGARAARPFQHADPNKYFTYVGMVWDNQSNGYISWEPNSTCVDLAPAKGAGATVNDPDAGVYVDGGRLYAFEGNDRFGVFIIRTDSKLYVPIAIDTSVYSGFGDNMTETYGQNRRSHRRTVQMTVSPSGRFAAMKLKTNTDTGWDTYKEPANSTKIIVFSLTGEHSWGGEPYRIIDTGSDGSTNYGTYMYAMSMAMTDTYLYYLCGNFVDSDTCYRQHAIYRHEMLGAPASGALLSPGFGGGLNDAGGVTSMVQTPFQVHQDLDDYDFVTTSFSGSFASGFFPTGINVAISSRDMYVTSGANTLESHAAPMPFRVSGDGKVCAILAGAETNSTNHHDNMLHHVWVDVEGTFKPVTYGKTGDVARHSPQGGSRGYTLTSGARSRYHYGGYTGPTTGFEISYNGDKIAVVVNRQGQGTSTTVDGNVKTNWYNYRQDVIAWATYNQWTNRVLYNTITGPESGTPRFSSTHLWRFGALIFTRDPDHATPNNSDGLIFWGGTSSFASGANTFSTSNQFTGSFYSCQFQGPTTAGPDVTSTAVFIRHIFSTTDGGSTAAFNSASNLTTVNPAFIQFNGQQGKIRPIGGFISENGKFAYITALSAIGSDSTGGVLLGINIKSVVPTSGNINGRTNGLGFKVGGQAVRRGFLPDESYQVYYSIGRQDYQAFANYLNDGYGMMAPGNAQGASLQVMARKSGYVFYASHYQAQGPARSINAFTANPQPDGPDLATYYGGGWGYGGHVEGFSANVAGNVYRLTNTSLTGSDTSSRGIHWLEVHDTGRAVAYVYDSSLNNTSLTTEVVGIVQGVNFDAGTGVLNAAGKFDNLMRITGTTVAVGRAGGSMSFDASGRKLYVPFGVGAPGEGSKFIDKVTFQGGTFTAAQLGSVGRYEVLYSGR